MAKIILKESDYFQTALKNLRPETPNWYGWAKTDSSGNRIPDDQRMCWEHAIVVQDGVTKPTKAEFDAEVKRLKDEYSATEYQRQRSREYPSWQQQLEKIYDDGIDAWKTEMVDPIKAKYPKPGE
jgi:hypothetical protein